MILMIDNYDSFTFNIVRYCQELSYQIHIRRNDQITLSDIESLAPQHIIISPGPCSPNEAGISMPVIQNFSGKIPILGVCLGHQCIGQVFGATVEKAPYPMHGKVSDIQHTQKGLFQNLPTPLQVTRYHSLIVGKEKLPSCLEITALTNNDEIMALSHKTMPIVGVQFHPEAILTKGGHQIFRNFLEGKYR